MLNETASVTSRLITSLKVAAVVSVLGTVVLAAEHRLASAVPHERTIAAATTYAAPAADRTAQQATTDYFPARFPAPTGEPSEPAPSF